MGTFFFVKPGGVQLGSSMELGVLDTKTLKNVTGKLLPV